MKKIVMGVLLLSVLGCIPVSLNGIYTDKDSIFDSSLVGRWVSEDEEHILNFSRAGDLEYKVVYIDEENKTGTFKAHLVKLGENLFLDLFPNEPQSQDSGAYWIHLFPVHSFVWIKQMEPTLQIYCMNLDWLKKYLEKNPEALKHEMADGDRLILTASTKELQEFLVKHVTTEDAFREWGTFAKLQPVEKPVTPKTPSTEKQDTPKKP